MPLNGVGIADIFGRALVEKFEREQESKGCKPAQDVPENTPQGRS